MSKETTEALRFIMAFYEPGQTYLDTNAWKQAEAQARAALAAAEAPTVTQPVQEPVHVEAVATVQSGEDGLYLDWLIEGGICALVEGCTLVIPSRPITDDFGSGEVYVAAPQQSVPLTDEQIDRLWLHRLSIHDGHLMPQLRDLARAIERAHGIGSKS